MTNYRQNRIKETFRPRKDLLPKHLLLRIICFVFLLGIGGFLVGGFNGRGYRRMGLGHGRSSLGGFGSITSCRGTEHRNREKNHRSRNDTARKKRRFHKCLSFSLRIGVFTLSIIDEKLSKTCTKSLRIAFDIKLEQFSEI